jgi:hypothetical protein
MSTHYIAMAGLHGYPPQCCETFPTLDEAVDFLAQVHELDRTCIKQLKDERYLEFNFRPHSPFLKDDGNEYCEIEECDCNEPETHCSY